MGRDALGEYNKIDYFSAHAIRSMMENDSFTPVRPSVRLRPRPVLAVCFKLFSAGGIRILGHISGFIYI